MVSEIKYSNPLDDVIYNHKPAGLQEVVLVRSGNDEYSALQNLIDAIGPEHRKLIESTNCDVMVYQRDSGEYESVIVQPSVRQLAVRSALGRVKPSMDRQTAAEIIDLIRTRVRYFNNQEFKKIS